jgi:hypothetical protein
MDPVEEWNQSLDTRNLPLVNYYKEHEGRCHRTDLASKCLVDGCAHGPESLHSDVPMPVGTRWGWGVVHGWFDDISNGSS